MEYLQTLSQDTFNRAVAAFSGSGISIATYLIHFSFSTWAFDTTLKLVEVGMVGIVGGAAGIVGKRIVEKYIFKKSK